MGPGVDLLNSQIANIVKKLHLKEYPLKTIAVIIIIIFSKLRVLFLHQESVGKKDRNKNY